MQSRVYYLCVVVFIADALMGDGNVAGAMLALALLWAAYRGVRGAARTKPAKWALAFVERSLLKALEETPRCEPMPGLEPVRKTGSVDRTTVR